MTPWPCGESVSALDAVRVGRPRAPEAKHTNLSARRTRTPPGKFLDGWWTTLRSGTLGLVCQIPVETSRRCFSELGPALHRTRKETMGARNNDTYYLGYIGTKPCARGKGYASALIRAMADKACRLPPRCLQRGRPWADVAGRPMPRSAPYTSSRRRARTTPSTPSSASSSRRSSSSSAGPPPSPCTAWSASRSPGRPCRLARAPRPDVTAPGRV